MKQLKVAVRVTREEYMNFYAHSRHISNWWLVIGAILLGVVGLQTFMDAGLTSLTLLLLMVSVMLLMMKPLIIPFMRKGEGGRRYDASDVLKGAVGIVMDCELMTVQTACHEGTVPLSTMTDVLRTNDMMALVFGKELTVHIPLRCLTEEEMQALQDWTDGIMAINELIRTDGL